MWKPSRPDVVCVKAWEAADRDMACAEAWQSQVITYSVWKNLKPQGMMSVCKP